MTKDDLINYSDIELYNMARLGIIGRFPNNFWGGEDTLKTAKVLTRYMFENVLEWDLEKIKRETKANTFYDNKLGGMLGILFTNNVVNALLNAYPELEDWAKERNPNIQLNSLFKTQRETTKYTDEELIDNIKEKFTELSRNPVMREMDNPEGHVYTSRFGSWNNALIASDLLEDIRADIDDSEDEINKAQKIIKDFAYEKERNPTEEEIDNLFSDGEIKVYFKSLSGIYDYLTEGYTKEELIDILIDKRNKLGRTPTNKDIKFPRAIIFIDKFDSWENALKEAGLDT